jgi:hypothetical protein
VNHARRDLCGGHPAMGVPTAMTQPLARETAGNFWLGRQSRPVTHKGRTLGRLTLGVDEFPFLVSSDSR